MKLKIAKAQKVSEIQMKSGFYGAKQATADTDCRPGTAHLAGPNERRMEN